MTPVSVTDLVGTGHSSVSQHLVMWLHSRSHSMAGQVRVHCLHFHPTDTNHLYIGTDAVRSEYHYIPLEASKFIYFQREAKCSEQQAVNLYIQYSFFFFPSETLAFVACVRV